MPGFSYGRKIVKTELNDSSSNNSVWEDSC